MSSLETTRCTSTNSNTKRKPAIRFAEARRTGTCRFADRVAAISIEHYNQYVPDTFRRKQKQTCLATIVAAIPLSDDSRDNYLRKGFYNATSQNDYLNVSVNNYDCSFNAMDNNSSVVPLISSPLATFNSRSTPIVQVAYNQQIKNTPHSSSCRLVVVAMGVGTKFLSEATLRHEENEAATSQLNPTANYGMRVRDCHAEVLVRRAFRRYVSESILSMLSSSTAKTESKLHETTDGQPHQSNIFELCTNVYDDTIGSQKESSRNDNDFNDSYPDKRYRLRQGITLHMYCSSSPCGNSVLKKFTTMKKEVYLQDYDEDTWPQDLNPHLSIAPHSVPLGQFSLLVKKDQGSNDNQRTDSARCDATKDLSVSTADGENSNEHSKKLRKLLPFSVTSKQAVWPIYSNCDWCPSGTTTVWSFNGSLHTCSDKLARWNYLGLQGSLLSSVLQSPIYMTTITIGRKFNSATCRRAICCRLSSDTQSSKKIDQNNDFNNPRLNTEENRTNYGGKGPYVHDANLHRVETEHAKNTTTTASNIKRPKRTFQGENYSNVAYHVNHPVVMGTGVYMDETGVIDMSSLDRREGQDVRFHSAKSWVTWLRLNTNHNFDYSLSNWEYDVECIDGSTGLLDVHYGTARTSENTTPPVTQAPTKTLNGIIVNDKSVISNTVTSKVSTYSLTALFTEIRRCVQSENSENKIDKTEQENLVVGSRIERVHYTSIPSYRSLQQLRALKSSVAPLYEDAKLRLLAKHPVFKHWRRRYQQEKSTIVEEI